MTDRFDDLLLIARAEAEDGIARCDARVREALRPHSPLAAFLPIYVRQRQAFAILAMRHHARIEAMHYDSKSHGATVKRLYHRLRAGAISRVQWAEAMRVILGVQQ